jgi:lysozyme
MRILFALVVALAVAIAAAGFLYDRGVFRLNHPDPVRFPVRGIDVSHHQGRIDWPAVRAAGVEFAFIKASEGADHRDREFARNWEAAHRAGIARGAYHFFTFCTPGLSQAENFTSALGSAAGEIPPVADVEFSGNCRQWRGISEIRDELRRFLERVEASIGRRPILYFTGDAYARVLDGHFPSHPRWPRNVFWEPSDSRFGHWLFWQFADNGRVPGIDTLVDLNVFRGSRSDFDSLLLAGPRGS